MKKLIWNFTLLLIIYSLLFAQNISMSSEKAQPSVNHHFSAQHDSNVTLLGRWITGDCNSVFVDSLYAYVGTSNTLEILDISNPATPVSMGKLVIHLGRESSPTNKVFVYDHYAYYTHYDSIISVIDVSDVSKPILKYSMFLSDRVRDIFVVNNYAYVALEDSGLSIYDVHLASEPFRISTYYTGDGYTHRVTVSGDYAYIATSGGIHIVNITEPSDPVLVKFYNDSCKSSEIFVLDQTLYIAHWDGIFRIIDVSVPSVPTQVGYYKVAEGWSEGISVSGDRAYVIYGYKLYILDVSTPSAPIKVSDFEIEYWPYNLYASDDHAYIAVGAGLQIVDLRDNINPVQSGFFNTGGIPGGLFYLNNHVYLGNGYYGFGIIDVSEPSEPLQVGYCNMKKYEGANFILNNKIYSVGREDSSDFLQIIDLSNPRNPEEIAFGYFENEILDNQPYDLYVQGNYAYTIHWHGGFKVIDIHEPSAPKVIGECKAGDCGEEIFVDNDYAYVAGAVGGGWVTPTAHFSIINISDPSDPYVSGVYEKWPGAYQDFFISGKYAYIPRNWDFSEDGSTPSGLVDIIDVSDPSEPEKVSEYLTGWVRLMSDKDNYIYLKVANGIVILDISEPLNPQQVGHFNTGDVRSLTTYNQYIYVADTDGLYIFRNNLVSGMENKMHSPGLFSLKTNYPNPFNPITTIEYQLQKNAKVDLSIYNILGQKVATLVNKKQPTGSYEVAWDASGFASGVYLYQLKAGDHIETKKMILMK